MKFDFTVRTEQDLIDAVRTFGVVPLFANSFPGFSVEEHVSPEVWFSDENEGAWEWKGPVIRESGCAYGWGVAEYTTPEKLFGGRFTDAVYRREPEESRARLLAHLRKLLPDASEGELERFLG